MIEELKEILEKLYWQGRKNADIPITSISVQPELDKLLPIIRAEIAKELIEPTKYHYRCYASGTVCVKDYWGDTEVTICPSFNGDFNCGYRGCRNGQIKGLWELKPTEEAQNRKTRTILKLLGG